MEDAEPSGPLEVDNGDGFLESREGAATGGELSLTLNVCRNANKPNRPAVIRKVVHSKMHCAIMIW